MTDGEHQSSPQGPQDPEESGSESPSPGSPLGGQEVPESPPSSPGEPLAGYESQPSGAPAGYGSPGRQYPVLLDVQRTAQVERWRPLVLWLLSIPLEFVAYVYGIAAAVLLLIGWFAALFTARLPDSIGDFLAGYLRYTWRVTAYLYAFTTRYPAFELPSGRPDPGGDSAVVFVAAPTRLSRLAVFFRFLLIIPHAIVLSFVSIAAYVVMIVAWFAVLFTGRWPDGMRNFVVGFFRWTTRVNAYHYLLTDVYPPFSLN